MKKFIVFIGLTAISFGVVARPALAIEAEIVTLENFVQAESTHYFHKNAQENNVAVNEISHQRMMASIDVQDIIRMNQDTAYSIALVDVSEGVTVTLPKTDLYMSALFIDINHLNPTVIYAGESITLSKDDLTAGEHAYILFRTAQRTYDEAGQKEMNLLQDQIKIEANASNVFVGTTYDQDSLNEVRNQLIQRVLKGDLSGRVHTAAGKNWESVDKDAHLMAAAAGWALFPAEHAMYTSYIPGQGQSGCTYFTIDTPPLDYAGLGFFSVTTYDATGWIVEREFALNNNQAEQNKDGTWTFHFQTKDAECHVGAKNVIDVQAGWSGIFRMYKPTSTAEALEYTTAFLASPLKPDSLQ